MTFSDITSARTLLALAAAATSLAAQSFIVDVNGGPGANFTSINAAVAVVPDGAVLRIRPGNYAESVVVIAKGLSMVGDAGARIVAPAGLPGLRVFALQPSQTFVASRLQVNSSVSGNVVDVVLQLNQGLVFLDQIDNIALRRLIAVQCEALLVSRCSFTAIGQPGVTVGASRAVFDECSLMNVAQAGGDVQLANSLVGGSGPVVLPGAPGVTMQGGELRVLGGQLATGFSPLGPGPVITGFGNLRVGPGTQITAATPPFGPAINVVNATMPQVQSSLSAGTAYSVVATGEAGQLGVLIGSVRALPLQLPGVDSIWLDPATAQVFAAGIFGSGTVAAIVGLPTAPAFTGLSVVWQAFSFPPSGPWAVSNPTWRIVP